MAEILAEEIQRRGLKFADLPLGQYEMLSGEEHKEIIEALNKQLMEKRECSNNR